MVIVRLSTGQILSHRPSAAILCGHRRDVIPIAHRVDEGDQVLVRDLPFVRPGHDAREVLHHVRMAGQHVPAAELGRLCGRFSQENSSWWSLSDISCGCPRGLPRPSGSSPEAHIHASMALTATAGVSSTRSSAAPAVSSSRFGVT